MVVVYIPPSAVAAAAGDVINSTVAKLQTQHPDAFLAITGDFNHAPLDKTFNNFQQYMDCLTRDNKTLDLLYANAKDAYSASALPPLGRSDHNLVRLSPRYVPLVRRQPVHTRTMRRWSPEAAEALQDCFGSTNWEALCEPHGEDIDTMTNCITDYIRFCEDTVTCTRTVRCFPKNKPWITSDLKALLNKKKMTFRVGDRDEQRRVRRELKETLRKCRDNYRRKLESKLEQNCVKDVWTGLKLIIGLKGKDTLMAGSLERANQFNQFFNRFSSPTATPLLPPSPHTSTSSQVALHTFQLSPARPPSICPPSPSSYSLTSSPSFSTDNNTNPQLLVTAGQVKRQLERLHQGKAAGPDSITPRVLRTCASQLSPVQPELESAEGPVAMEDVTHSSCAQEGETVRPRGLQTCCSNISCDEGYGETDPCQAEA
ncbi:uncharacterized protein LOC106938767 [Poecilia latipinna]|uniref:uncharacterized protein LOC106938767 n=1 Tax=Poecilia latipinna TaxID=48699 RepID=UPI00072ED7D3|nr:PREDICTED: uncharacterized protein LOC106938767 [Poecilia latipinna]